MRSMRARCTAGFHAIEAKLFAGETAGAVPIVQALVEKLRRFSQEIPQEGHYRPKACSTARQGSPSRSAKRRARAASPAASGTSLDDMRHNLEASRQRTPLCSRRSSRRALRSSRTAPAAARRAQDAAPGASLKALDQSQVGKLSEQFAISLQTAAPKLGLKKPSLED